MQEVTFDIERKIMLDLGERVRAAVRRVGSAKAVADATGAGESTIYNYQRLKPPPPIDFLAKLADLAGVRPAWLFFGELPVGEDDESGDWETNLGPTAIGESRVPVYDVSASAGDGLEVFEGDPHSHFTMPLDWLMTLGNPDTIAIIKVRGDSMEPDLRSGDLAMIDTSQAALQDGVFAVLVAGHLFVKRVQVVGKRKAMLSSSNPQYPPFEVTVDDDDNMDQDASKIIGRVVWSGRAM